MAIRSWIPILFQAVHRSVVVRAALCALLLSVGAELRGHLVPGLASAQLTAGATLTVLRGTVGVLRADGSPVSPAASGMTLGVGDQIATVGQASALVTLFEGSEIELGADTTIILKDLDAQGQRTTIAIESVLGATIHRVVTLADPGSSYRVEAGGSVAVVRGTVFAHYVDAAGDITLAVGEGTMEFPRTGMLLRRGEKRTLTSRGDVVDGRFDPASSLFTTVTEPASSGNPSGTENPGLGTGSFVVPQQQSAAIEREQEERDTKQPQVSLAGRTFLTVAAPSGSVRLEVASIDGFAIGDAVVIGTGPSAEIGTIVGFGSIILQQPLKGSFAVGTLVERLPSGALFATPTGTAGVIGTTAPTPTATATPTGTVGVIGTVGSSPTPTATATPLPPTSATATQTVTATPSLAPTERATSTATATATSTADSGASPTATSTATATATSTLTPPFPCLGPLVREQATRGSGVTGTTQRAVTGGVLLEVYVALEDAEPSTTFDVWIDIAGGAAGTHWPVGTFTTNEAGAGTFTKTVVVPFVGAQIDNEIVRSGDLPSQHQYIRELFTPCPGQAPG